MVATVPTGWAGFELHIFCVWPDLNCIFLYTFNFLTTAPFVLLQVTHQGEEDASSPADNLEGLAGSEIDSNSEGNAASDRSQSEVCEVCVAGSRVRGVTGKPYIVQGSSSTTRGCGNRIHTLRSEIET